MDALLGALMKRVEVSAENAAGIAIGYICILLFLGAALFAFTLAAAILIAEVYGGAVAALCVGIFFLVMAAILAITLTLRKRRRQMARTLRSPVVGAEAGLVGQALPAMLRASPLGTLLVISLGAYLIARGTKPK